MRLVVFGAALAVAGSRLVSSLLFGVEGTDPWTFAAVVAGTLAAAALACWLPARKATAIDPLAVLRTE